MCSEDQNTHIAANLKLSIFIPYLTKNPLEKNPYVSSCNLDNIVSTQGRHSINR